MRSRGPRRVTALLMLLAFFATTLRSLLVPVRSLKKPVAMTLLCLLLARAALEDERGIRWDISVFAVQQIAYWEGN
jgi:hypothetical protein